MTCTILYNLQNTNLQALLENSIPCNFQIKACFTQSAQQTKKIDLNYYETNCQLFRVAYVILCNLQNTKLQILPAKTPGNLNTD